MIHETWASQRRNDGALINVEVCTVEAFASLVLELQTTMSEVQKEQVTSLWLHESGIRGIQKAAAWKAQTEELLSSRTSCV